MFGKRKDASADASGRGFFSLRKRRQVTRDIAELLSTSRVELPSRRWLDQAQETITAAENGDLGQSLSRPFRK